MPIYEYEAASPDQACPKCRRPFEVIQNLRDKPVRTCPDCGQPVKRIISWCRAAVMETPDEYSNTMRRIRNFESEGMWSHAAELSDKEASKTKDSSLKTRALDNYKKAGYDPKTLDKHAKSDDL
ncbi:MAG: zinc ribbon domain-containing protein [Proteobacteria bacterium]|nr:zinc ribbon domain-containing protein [Pseudomonadota bacterium]